MRTPESSQPASQPAAPVSVKICGLTRAEDITCAQQSGADFYGIILFARSPRYVAPALAGELCQHIDKGKRVFVDVNTPTDQLADYAALGFDKFQIHCEAGIDLATVAAWSGIVGRENLWLAPRIAPGESFPQDLLHFADTVLIDTFRKDGGHGGSGQTGDWHRFREWSTLYQHKQFILAGGLNPENLSAAIAASGTSFVDLNSGLEAAPGIKDHAKVRAALAVAKGRQGN